MPNAFSCNWCSDQYDYNSVCNCVCTEACGHDACVKGPIETLITGEIIVKGHSNAITSTSTYPTTTGQKCIWCHTTETCEGKKACICEKDCKAEHCLLGPNKGEYNLSKGTSSWAKYKNGNQASGDATTHGYGGGYQSVTTTTFDCSKDSHPDTLFTWQGIKFSGQKKHTLESRPGRPGDPKRLIVNASNSSFSSDYKPTPTKIVDRAPDGLKDLEDLSLAISFPPYGDELALNWSDGKALPADLQWWEKFLELVVKEGYEEVHVCCLGGHGRTGTFLGIILMLTHKWNKSPSIEAEQWINKHYCKKAIETKEQQDYMDWIGERMMEPKGEPASDSQAIN